MFALRQIIEDPQDVVVVPTEFRHRPIEIIFMALDLNSTELPPQDTITNTTSKILRENWFENYKVEDDMDVLLSIPTDEVSEEWEW